LTLDVVADLVVGQETGGSGVLSCLSRTWSFGVETVVGLLLQAEGLAVKGHPHHYLPPGYPLRDPVVDGEVLKAHVKVVPVGTCQLTAL
jgi:hypothetical protein